MAQKMTGALVFDERTDRYDIRFDLADYYGGRNGARFDAYHCQDVLVLEEGGCRDLTAAGKELLCL